MQKLFAEIKIKPILPQRHGNIGIFFYLKCLWSRFVVKQSIYYLLSGFFFFSLLSQTFLRTRYFCKL